MNDSEKVRTEAQLNFLTIQYQEECCICPIVDQISEALSKKGDARRAGRHYPAGHQGSRALPPRDVRQPAVHKLPPLAGRGPIFEGTDHLLPALRGNMGGPGEGASGHYEEGAKSASTWTQIPIRR